MSNIHSIDRRAESVAEVIDHIVDEATDIIAIFSVVKLLDGTYKLVAAGSFQEGCVAQVVLQDFLINLRHHT